MKTFSSNVPLKSFSGEGCGEYLMYLVLFPYRRRFLMEPHFVPKFQARYLSLNELNSIPFSPRDL